MSYFRDLMMASGGAEPQPWERYAQDGLVFQLDCETECSDTSWKDIKGGIELSGTSISLTNGVPTFGGSSYYVSADKYNVAYSTGTIECCYYTEPASNYTLVHCYKNIGLICASGYYQPISVDNVVGKRYVRINSTARRYYLSANASSAYESQTQLTSNGTDYWNSTLTGLYIGYSTRFKFSGRIYAVRVYNRQLTADEMKANQAIDMARFADK